MKADNVEDSRSGDNDGSTTFSFVICAAAGFLSSDATT